MRFTQAIRFAKAALLEQSLLAAARGPFGGNGAVASIPGSAAIAGQQPYPVTQPGILDLINSPTPPYSAADSKQTRCAGSSTGAENAPVEAGA
jgi:hypothetical protein